MKAFSLWKYQQVSLNSLNLQRNAVKPNASGDRNVVSGKGPPFALQELQMRGEITVNSETRCPGSTPYKSHVFSSDLLVVSFQW